MFNYSLIEHDLSFSHTREKFIHENCTVSKFDNAMHKLLHDYRIDVVDFPKLLKCLKDVLLVLRNQDIQSAMDIAEAITKYFSLIITGKKETEAREKEIHWENY